MDYLAQRRADIEAQMKALRAELAEIKIAEAALAGVGTESAAPPVVVGGSILRAGSIKDWIMKAMSAFPNGLETDAVIEAIRKMGGPLVIRSSVTPQLSRLKAAGLIEYNGRHWRLPVKDEPEKDETPDGYQPSSASGLEDLLDEETPS